MKKYWLKKKSKFSENYKFTNTGKSMNSKHKKHEDDSTEAHYSHIA